DCDTTCCPDSCTSCTTASPMPAKTAAGETIAPAPGATTNALPSKPVTGLFHRHKPADVQPRTTKIENLDGTPVASDKKEDPPKTPAAYSKTPAELAGATMPKTDMPKSDMSKTDMPATDISKASAPLVPNGKVPLGAGSVLQAGDPRYVPVPIV